MQSPPLENQPYKWQDVTDAAQKAFCIESNVKLKLTIIHGTSALLAATYIFLLSFFTKPVPRKWQNSSLYRSHFGIPIPANFLTDRRPLWIYLIVWLSTSATLMGILTNNFAITNLKSINLPQWVCDLLGALAIFALALSKFPLFAFVYHGGLLNWSLGVAYCIVEICLLVWYFQTAVCHTTHSMTYQLCQQVPSFVGYTILLIYFLVKLYRNLHQCNVSCDLRSERNKVLMIENLINRVRASLTSKYIQQQKQAFIRHDQSSVNVNRSAAGLSLARWFQIPTLTCSLFVSTVLLITMACLVIIEGPVVMHVIRTEINDQFPIHMRQNWTSFNKTHVLVIYKKLRSCANDEFTGTQCWLILAEFITMFFISAIDLGKLTLIASCLLAMVANLVQLGLILRSIQSKLEAFRRGNFGKIMGTFSSYDTEDLVEGNLSFFAYQIAYIVWAMTIQTVVFWWALTSLILLYIWLHDIVGFAKVLAVLISYLPIIILGLVTWLGQKILVRFVFLQRRGKVLALKNLRLFLLYQYFANFFNLLVGLFTSVQRVVYGAFIGIFLLGRLDIPMLPKSFVKFDSGHMSFLGFIFTELTHNHPHLRLFILILLLTGLDDERAHQLVMCPNPEGAVSRVEFDRLKEEIEKQRSFIPCDRQANSIKDNDSELNAPIDQVQLETDAYNDNECSSDSQHSLPYPLKDDRYDCEEASPEAIRLVDRKVAQKRSSRRLVAKWLIAYTLVKNPGLRLTRKSFLCRLARL